MRKVNSLLKTGETIKMALAVRLGQGLIRIIMLEEAASEAI